MQYRQDSNGQLLIFKSKLGAGGEAEVFAHPSDSSLVAKIYRTPSLERTKKLTAMLLNPPDDPTRAQNHISIAWPSDLIRSANGDNKVVGFLMPRIPKVRTIIDFYNPKTRREQLPLFNYFYLLHTARNLAAAAHSLHSHGYVIGDINESNIIVAETSLVTLVDTDSFQVQTSNGTVFRCTVGKPEFTPPELQGTRFSEIDRNIEHDLFGLSVLFFQLLMEGTHPFAGKYKGNGDAPEVEKRIAAGHFTYSLRRQVPYAPMPFAPLWETLHPKLRALFVCCFEDGHTNPQARPSAHIWANTLGEVINALRKCPVNEQHRYGDHLSQCPWCERTKQLQGRDPFPSQLAVKRGLHLQARSLAQVSLPSVTTLATAVITATPTQIKNISSTAGVTISPSVKQAPPANVFNKKYLIAGIAIALFLAIWGLSNRQNNSIAPPVASSGILGSPSTPAPVSKPDSSPNLILKGKINNRINIEMNLQKSGTSLSGSYFYRVIGESIRAEGTIDQANNFSLRGFSNDGNLIDQFEGNINSNSIVSGKYIRQSDAKTMPFLLQVTFSNDAAFKKTRKAPSLPLKIEEYLDANYSGWKLTNVATGCEIQKATVSGDFNGDGKPDYGVKFLRGARGYIMAFVSQGIEYKPFILEDEPGKGISSQFLDIGRKGEKYPEFNDGPTGGEKQLRYDAIAGGTCESSGYFYIYQNGDFKRDFFSD